VNVRREQLETLVEVLEGLKPRPEVLKLFHEVVLDVWKQRQQNAAELRLLAQRRLDELKHRKARLVEALFTKPPSTKTLTRRNATTSIGERKAYAVSRFLRSIDRDLKRVEEGDHNEVATDPFLPEGVVCERLRTRIEHPTHPRAGTRS
jgi:hypothetical protein